MRLLIAGLTVTLMGCATVPAAPDAAGGNWTCDASPLSDLVGRPATQELGAEAMRRSGSGRLRWIQPGQAVTMDYHAGRLNIRLDSANRVEGFSCG